MVRRIRQHNEPENAQWQTIYCSLMLLLLVFFVMLTAYSSIDSRRMTLLKVIRNAGGPPSTPETYGMERAVQSVERLTQTSGIDCSIQKNGDNFKVVIPNPVLFASGDATLNEKIYPVLDSIVAIARENDLAVQVEGHTDNIPISNRNFRSNWELSTTRAVNILRYLQSNGHLPAKRLIAVGFAEYRPIADNGTEEGRLKNRRIEIIFRRAT